MYVCMFIITGVFLQALKYLCVFLLSRQRSAESSMSLKSLRMERKSGENLIGTYELQ